MTATTGTQHSVDRIRSVLAEADANTVRLGLDWYPNAKRACRRLARKHGVPVGYVAKVVAALSPRTRWACNLRRADAFLGNSDRRWMASHNRNLEHCLADRPLSGPKVQAFERCLMGAQDSVCVDVWATRVAECPAPTTPPRYRHAAECYRLAAASTPYSPRDLQAITWIIYRGSHA